MRNTSVHFEQNACEATIHVEDAEAHVMPSKEPHLSGLSPQFTICTVALRDSQASTS